MECLENFAWRGGCPYHVDKGCETVEIRTREPALLRMVKQGICGSEEGWKDCLFYQAQCQFYRERLHDALQRLPKGGKS